MISIIVAIADNLAIGINNTLPWKLPADLAYFKKITMGKTMVMGQRTFDSVGGRSLGGRKTIILNKEPNYQAPENCQFANSIEEVLELAKDQELMICGGASVYKQFLPHADRLYLTFVHHSFEADTFFPEIDYSKFKEIKREERTADNENPYNLSFVTYEKNV